MTRRTMLGGAVATLGLAACSPSGQESAPPQAGTAQTPTYQQFEGVTPDLPGTPGGVPPMFVDYPKPPVVRDGFPLAGGEPFTILQRGGAALPTQESNPNYQLLQEQAGTEFEMIFGGSGNDYQSKFQVTVASGDVPDIVQMIPVTQMPKMLEATFLDLSEVLGGEAITKYPGLAAIPTPAWTIPSVNGRLWGLPQPRPPAGVAVIARGDLMEKRGVSDPANLALRDGNDFVDLLRQLTNRDRDEFAMSGDPAVWLFHCVKQMAGTPNVWGRDGDTFVHENETEEIREALSHAAEIYQAGYLHPNSISQPSQNSAWFASGITALHPQSFVRWGGYARRYPDWKITNIELPKWDGGGMAPIRKSAPAYSGFMVFKKTSDSDRIDQLLRFADYIASPFGTSQFVDVNYGVEGVTFEMKDGNPVLLEDAPTRLPTYLAGSVFSVLFGQGERETVEAQHEYLSRALPAGIDDATLGLYSETAVSKAATMEAPQNDLIRQVMRGNKTLADWDDFVTRWQSSVGDQMAAEYAEAAQQG